MRIRASHATDATKEANATIKPTTRRQRSLLYTGLLALTELLVELHIALHNVLHIYSTSPEKKCDSTFRSAPTSLDVLLDLV